MVIDKVERSYKILRTFEKVTFCEIRNKNTSLQIIVYFKFTKFFRSLKFTHLLISWMMKSEYACVYYSLKSLMGDL